jgi:hypothetical protein
VTCYVTVCKATALGHLEYHDLGSTTLRNITMLQQEHFLCSLSSGIGNFSDLITEDQSKLKLPYINGHYIGHSAKTINLVLLGFFT